MFYLSPQCGSLCCFLTRADRADSIHSIGPTNSVLPGPRNHPLLIFILCALLHHPQTRSPSLLGDSCNSSSLAHASQAVHLLPWLRDGSFQDENLIMSFSSLKYSNDSHWNHALDLCPQTNLHAIMWLHSSFALQGSMEL